MSLCNVLCGIKRYKRQIMVCRRNLIKMAYIIVFMRKQLRYSGKTTTTSENI